MNYERILLELMDRISQLEEDVKQLKTQNHRNITPTTGKTHSLAACNRKDTTKYIMDGKRFGKNRLVLAVVQKYVLEHPNISAQQLMSTFDKSLQGSLGVVRTYRDAKLAYVDSARRFFMQPGEVIHTATAPCVVCSQWGAFNIDFFISRARELGFSITEI